MNRMLFLQVSVCAVVSCVFAGCHHHSNQSIELKNSNKSVQEDSFSVDVLSSQLFLDANFQNLLRDEVLSKKMTEASADTEWKKAIRSAWDNYNGALKNKLSLTGDDLASIYFSWKEFSSLKSLYITNSSEKIGSVQGEINQKVHGLFFKKHNNKVFPITDISQIVEADKKKIEEEVNFKYATMGKTIFAILWDENIRLLQEKTARINQSFKMDNFDSSITEAVQAVYKNTNILDLLGIENFFQRALTGVDSSVWDMNSLLFGAPINRVGIEARRGHQFAEYLGATSFSELSVAANILEIEEPYNLAVSQFAKAANISTITPAASSSSIVLLESISSPADESQFEKPAQEFLNAVQSGDRSSEDFRMKVHAFVDADKERAFQVTIPKLRQRVDSALCRDQYKRLQQMMRVFNMSNINVLFPSYVTASRDNQKFMEVMQELLLNAKQELDYSLSVNADLVSNPDKEVIMDIKENPLLSGDKTGFLLNVFEKMGELPTEVPTLLQKRDRLLNQYNRFISDVSSNFLSLKEVLKRMDLSKLKTPEELLIKDNISKIIHASIDFSNLQNIDDHSDILNYIFENPADLELLAKNSAPQAKEVENWLHQVPDEIMGLNFDEIIHKVKEASNRVKSIESEAKTVLKKHQEDGFDELLMQSRLGIFFGGPISSSTGLSVGTDMLNSSCLMASRRVVSHFYSSSFKIEHTRGQNSLWNVPCSVSLEGEWSDRAKDIYGVVSTHVGKSMVGLQFSNSLKHTMLGARVTYISDLFFSEIAAGSMWNKNLKSSQMEWRTGVEIGILAPFVQAQYRLRDDSVSERLLCLGLEIATFEKEFENMTMTTNLIAKAGVDFLSKMNQSQMKSVGSLSANVEIKWTKGIALNAVVDVENVSDRMQLFLEIER
jgi:hypothetical protein